MNEEITEFIEAGIFNSHDFNLFLLERDAPSPDEKEVIENIPYMQGVLDFSMILGERIFSNREITYKFQAFDVEYEDRKLLEIAIKQKLMPFGKQQIFDTHDLGYYWLGKCKSVEVEDDAEYNCLAAKIVFDCYPYAFTMQKYFDDVWDTFNFKNDIASFTRWVISGSKTLYLYNSGTVSISPLITVSAPMAVTTEDGRIYNFSSGENSTYDLLLTPGENILTISGSGEISFNWSAEVMA